MGSRFSGTGFPLELRIGPQQLLDPVALKFQRKRDLHAFKPLLVHGGVPRCCGPDAGHKLPGQDILIPGIRKHRSVIAPRNTAFQGHPVEFVYGKLLRVLGNIVNPAAFHNPVAGKFVQQRLVAVRQGRRIGQHKRLHFHLRLKVFLVHQGVNHPFRAVFAQHHFHRSLRIVQDHPAGLVLGLKRLQAFLLGSQAKGFRGEKTKGKHAHNKENHHPHAPVGGFGLSGAWKLGRTRRIGRHSVRHEAINTQKLMNRAA